MNQAYGMFFLQDHESAADSQSTMVSEDNSSNSIDEKIETQVSFLLFYFLVTF
jgi:hypothetical protein